ncbi:27176_t:CDS:1, partial [Racocetra persica]
NNYSILPNLELELELFLISNHILNPKAYPKPKSLFQTQKPIPNPKAYSKC